MKINTEQLTHGTRIIHDGKPIYLKTWELMDVVAYMGELEIVVDGKTICDTRFCYDIYCDEFGSRFAEMKLKRVANMYLLGHPLLNVPWKQRTVPDPDPEKDHKRFILKKRLDQNNYVCANYYYYRF